MFMESYEYKILGYGQQEVGDGQNKQGNISCNFCNCYRTIKNYNCTLHLRHATTVQFKQSKLTQMDRRILYVVPEFLAKSLTSYLYNYKQRKTSEYVIQKLYAEYCVHKPVICATAV